jgi:hypothetical protein
MLIWCHPDHVADVSQLMRDYWLADSGDEPGAADYRVNVKPMIAGMAAGYIAKYIAKNIDDANIDTHGDDLAGGMTVGPDLLGDLEVKPCNRVEAWASLWRIRQFQAIGQPGVGVWRELRRVTAQAAAAGSDAFVRAWASVHKTRGHAANWGDYMREQGGAMLPRKDYRFCVHKISKDKKGRYETVREQWACGVLDLKAGAMGVTPTKRERWGAQGFAAQRRVLPWTRLNNCTGQNRKSVGVVSNHINRMAEFGVLDREGGFQPWQSDVKATNNEDDCYNW